MCRERDSNPHDRFGSRDFKSLVSTNSTIAAHLLCGCKGTPISPNHQIIYQLFRNSMLIICKNERKFVLLYR